jgi:hypothetical protein
MKAARDAIGLGSWEDALQDTIDPRVRDETKRESRAGVDVRVVVRRELRGFQPRMLAPTVRLSQQMEEETGFAGVTTVMERQPAAV